MKKAVRKIEMLHKLEALLIHPPKPLTRSEIARKLGIHRATAGRYIDELSLYAPVEENQEGRFYIQRSKYLNHIKLTLHEVFALYLASRLLAFSFPDYSPHTATAVKKLGLSLKHLSPLISRYIADTAECFFKTDGDSRRNIELMEYITAAWSDSRKLKIEYFSKKSNALHVYTASIYMIEPYPIGKTIHLFAYTEENQKVQTFRLDRIQKAAILPCMYTVPQDFDYTKQNRDAWGIWISNGNTTEVVLRFSAHAAPRVTETLWHKGQSLTPCCDGCVLWSAAIAQPLEMLPWIRGWGADVEILKPKELREGFKKELQIMTKTYHLSRKAI